MKKSLVLAMAMALGVTASAYAANPFSDVPAGHWAYDSIDKLAAAGVIDGMGDGTFQGDRNMTRYEMAQIVAKAMAKGANVDKLAAEFADELDALGVRVANLEKKADNVKITGNINYWYKAGHGGAANSAGVSKDKNWLRSDITLSGAINEDWKYTAMVRNEHEFQHGANGVGEERLDFQRAWIDGRLFGLKVKAGRHNKVFADAAIYNNRIDGVEVAYGKDVKLTVGYAQLANANGNKLKWNKVDEIWEPTGPAYNADAKVTYAELDWKVNKALAFDVDYYMFRDTNGGDSKVVGKDGDGEVLNIGAKLALGKDLKVRGQYLHASDGDEKDGWIAAINYKGAKAAKPGSWGLYAQWVDVGANIMFNDGGYSTYAYGTKGGFHGYEIGGNYAFAKNIVGAVEYYDLKACGKHDKNQTMLFNLNFKF